MEERTEARIPPVVNPERAAAANVEEELQLQQTGPCISPGMRFNPTDDELIKDYLQPKVNNKPNFWQNIIVEINVYNFDPVDLKGMGHDHGTGNYYFFTPRHRKYPNGMRPTRSTPKGFWRATKKEEQVRDAQGRIVGTKRVLNYYTGRAAGQANRDNRTSWSMHEYMLPRSSIHHSKGTRTLDERILVKVYQKPTRRELSQRRRQRRQETENENAHQQGHQYQNHQQQDGGFPSDERTAEQVVNNERIAEQQVNGAFTLEQQENERQHQQQQQLNNMGFLRQGRQELQHSMIAAASNFHNRQAHFMIPFLEEQHHQQFQQQQQQQQQQPNIVGYLGNEELISGMNWRPMMQLQHHQPHQHHHHHQQQQQQQQQQQEQEWPTSELNFERLSLELVPFHTQVSSDRATFSCPEMPMQESLDANPGNTMDSLLPVPPIQQIPPRDFQDISSPSYDIVNEILNVSGFTDPADIYIKTP